jgi:hypothetical protein
MDDGGREDERDPPASLDGNRVWRVDTPAGPVLQKYYAERGSFLHAWGRELGSRLRGAKTGTRAAARRATEARLLALWREHGCAVPADLSAQHPELANERTLVLEFVEGPKLSDRLRDPALDGAPRAKLLADFAAAWGRRHRLAIERREPGLVQEHGTLEHVIVAGAAGAPRFVSFDHENAFRRSDVEAHVSKEIASVLTSLYRAQPRAAGERVATEAKDARFREDLRAVISGYGDPAPLWGTCERYLRPQGLWALVCRIDRAREEKAGKRAGKFRLVGLLEEVLRASNPT